VHGAREGVTDQGEHLCLVALEERRPDTLDLR
jgi:hypothetical protein